MGIDQDGDAVFRRFLNNRADIVEILEVVYVWAGVFNRFPGNEQAHERHAPFAEAREVLVRVLQWKGPADE
jgi:hypothetical protein